MSHQIGVLPWQALLIAGSLSAGCVALYTGLSAAGVDDVLAGNIVLLALAGIGAYLVFFDGGTPKKAGHAFPIQNFTYGVPCRRVQCTRFPQGFRRGCTKIVRVACGFGLCGRASWAGWTSSGSLVVSAGHGCFWGAVWAAGLQVLALGFVRERVRMGFVHA